MVRGREMGLATSALLWWRSNVLVSTSCVAVPPCFSVGTSKEMSEMETIFYSSHLSLSLSIWVCLIKFEVLNPFWILEDVWMKEVEVVGGGWWLVSWICCLNLLSPFVSFYPFGRTEGPKPMGFYGDRKLSFYGQTDQSFTPQPPLFFSCTILSMYVTSATQPNFYLLSVISYLLPNNF